jgi:4-amino-4-deoxy-L-arabinose transferase-like glycosyltransferase/tetratricopeptide (TPR) repeat protein
MLPVLKQTLRWIPLVVGVIAVLARFWVVDHGFPDVNEEATSVRLAMLMWDRDTGDIDLNPHFFNYPALTFYLNAAAQSVYRFIANPTSPDSVTDRVPLDLVRIGRLINILSMIGIAWITYLLGKMLMPRRWALWSGALMLVIPLFIRYSVTSIVDIPLTLFTSWCLLEIARAFRRPTEDGSIRIGLAIGLAASVKYTGALLAVPYLLTLLDRSNWRSLRFLLTPAPYLAGATAIIVFLVTNPYVALDFDTFYEHFSFEREHAATGHFGKSASSILTYLIALWDGLGPLGLAALLAGLISTTVSSRRSAWAPVTGFALTFPCLLFLWPTSFPHYLMPAYPAFALLVFAGVRHASLISPLAVNLSIRRNVLPIAVCLSVFIGAVTEFETIASPKPRALAREWIEAQVPTGSTIASESSGPAISQNRHAVILPIHSVFPEQTGAAYSPLWYAPIEYFIRVEDVAKRYRSDPTRFPDHVALYRHLEESWEQVAVFSGPYSEYQIYKNAADLRALTTYPDSLYARLDRMDSELSRRFLTRMAKAFTTSEQLELAADLYDHLVSRQLVQRKHLLPYADVLVRLGQTDRAIDVLESNRAGAGDGYLASLHYMKGHLDSAAVAWTRIAKDRPGNLPVRANLVNAYLSLNRHSAALPWILEIINLGGANADSYAQASAILINTGEIDRATPLLKEALVKWPEHAQLKEMIEYVESQ